MSPNRRQLLGFSAGLDAPHEDSAVTRGVDDASATDGDDNADQGVESDEDDDDDLPRLTTEDDDSNSNEYDSNSDEDKKNVEDGTPADILNEDSVDNESSPVPKTSSRFTRKPNVIIPTVTSKSHGNSRDQGVNFPLVGKYHPDNDRDCIACQYAGASYKTKQVVVHFKVVYDAPPHLRP